MSATSVSGSSPAAHRNPHYHVRYAENGPAMTCFSKRYDDVPNPRADYVAVLTCTEADASCPVIAGASIRIALPYGDPKAADGTAEEADRYDERCRQIASEMLYVFARVAV